MTLWMILLPPPPQRWECRPPSISGLCVTGARTQGPVHAGQVLHQLSYSLRPASKRNLFYRLISAQLGSVNAFLSPSQQGTSPHISCLLRVFSFYRWDKTPTKNNLGRKQLISPQRLHH